MGSQEQGTVVRGQREKIQNEQMGDKRFGNEGSFLIFLSFEKERST